MSGKDTNPKTQFGSKKTPLESIPSNALAEVGLAFLEGALKYGRYNYRIAGVSASTYHEAMQRHEMAWWHGQDRDPLTKVKHLASVIACASIVLDAEMTGLLNDDRPPAVDLTETFKKVEEVAAHLKEIFKDRNPKQYTIKDGSRQSIKMEAFSGVLLTQDGLFRVDQATGLLKERIGDPFICKDCGNEFSPNNLCTCDKPPPKKTHQGDKPCDLCGAQPGRVHGPH